ncbi:hypothetical protein K435DRAFT_813533 [Dendrothele bispora CBS 962.96]|uniref:Uncharacterized protein n=1 Tax=Dendrothele bispora (strain CBS 962.96) TaxID=1314807 RepID=A0A4S8KLB9_DENBC|nr:hypothetical protein K435DRAFT_813533 [Dendrothele bispora CBS 962.96]
MFELEVYSFFSPSMLPRDAKAGGYDISRCFGYKQLDPEIIRVINNKICSETFEKVQGTDENENDELDNNSASDSDTRNRPAGQRPIRFRPVCINKIAGTFGVNGQEKQRSDERCITPCGCDDLGRGLMIGVLIQDGYGQLRQTSVMRMDPQKPANSRVWMFLAS